jgi:hypothetical protein
MSKRKPAVAFLSNEKRTRACLGAEAPLSRGTHAAFGRNYGAIICDKAAGELTELAHDWAGANDRVLSPSLD